ncbi:uncharacterized protein LOC141645985 [Silene latifolia]|uniref:uncharacterized protein LOC141645985 n=1 Tax=Silene latifolia TaxID=37657 RepID=UPI003D77D817
MLNDTPLMRKYVEDKVKLQESYLHVFRYAPYGPITDHLDDMDKEIGVKCILDVVEALIAAHENGIPHAKMTVKKLYIGITYNVQIANFGYCIHEARREHEEIDDVKDDVIDVPKALLAKKELSHFHWTLLVQNTTLSHLY